MKILLIGATLLALNLFGCQTDIKPARAQIQPETKEAFGTLCDTIEQAERLHELMAQGAQDPIKSVNDEAQDPTACLMTMFFYFDGGVAKDLGDADVKRVMVVAVMTLRGPAVVQNPPTQYWLVKKSGQAL